MTRWQKWCKCSNRGSSQRGENSNGAKKGHACGRMWELVCCALVEGSDCLFGLTELVEDLIPKSIYCGIKFDLQRRRHGKGAMSR